ncbi:hypothetical protein C5167_047531 [Papaver somniferum]|uniref:NADP-dependent oxidoreductase domain-containing protein n=2 Tax=Papaver somniferum TaxID=3469 RepID=A0A4Y7LIF6_PAPSO|nr:bifunctional protein STORR [Papaver somniferum]AKO60180.1 reticuline epimerase [Papaver somniferum subsp. setigerum]RZC84747.1 hypothetical protein C5167_047531 [Papaver somniferum]
MELQYISYFQPTSSVVALLLALVSILSSVVVLRKTFLNNYSSSPASSTKTAVLSHQRQQSCALPISGLLHIFMNKNGLIHVTLGNMADKYGPIFSFPTGSHRTLVVSSWEMVKECFTGNNDTAFSNRPIPLAFKTIFYACGGIDSYGLSSVPYGKYWRELRKVCVHNLLSNQQLLKFRHLIISQVDTSFNKLYELCKNSEDNQGNYTTTTTAAGMVRIDDWLAELSFNVIGRIVCGFQSGPKTGAPSRVEQFKEAINEASYFMSTSPVSDNVPMLGWIDQLTGLTRNMKHCGKKLDLVVESIINDHRQKRRFSRTKGGDEKDDEQDDFIDICLSIMEQPQLPGNNNPSQIPIKSIVLDMIGGGTDTTKLTTIWTLSLLLNNPHVLDKAKQEVDAHFRTKRRSTNDAAAAVVDFDDIRNLVYIQAIIKESMRLYPASPVVERLSGEDCVVGGFHVPAGTRLWANVWKMQRDPKVWDDPLVFRPDRFLSDEQKMVDVRGQNYELLPFGAGRRVCPGVSFSLDLMQLVLTRLILEFEMKSPSGKVDMTATPGLMSYKVIPLDILLTHRRIKPCVQSAASERDMESSGVPVITLGSGKVMPVLGMGTFEKVGKGSERERLAILKAIEVGYRYFDTAAAYETEEVLGEAIAEALQLGLVKSRDELFISSMLWCTDAHADRVLLALQNSLRNLKLEYVDLYMLPFPASLKPGKITMDIPEEDICRMDYRSVWAAMEECQNLGFTKSIGVSNFSCKKLQELMATANIPPAVNQVEMSPAFQQKKLREYCNANNILVSAISVLGSNGTPWGSNAVLGSEVLKKIAMAKGKSVAQVSMRWVYEQGASLVVKSFSEERLRENLNIFDWELTKEDHEKIGEIPQCRILSAYFLVSPNGPFKSQEELWDDEA